MTEKDRFKSAFLIKEFIQRYGCKPKWIVRCPGRVNLIGEHIDYSGYGVFPMAIAQSIYIAFAPTADGILRIQNVDQRFESHSYECTLEWTGVTNPKWFHYFMSGWTGAKQFVNGKSMIPDGALNVLVYGEIPMAAGLSSSSALVSAAALVTLITLTGKVFNGYSKHQLADISAKAERLVGVEGGGMDQAVVILAEEGAALRVDFDPLKSYSVPLPSNALIGVIHSGVDSPKAATSNYNQRVVECRIAAQLMYYESNTNGDGDAADWKIIRRLRDLNERTGISTPKQVSAMLSNFPYTRAQILQKLRVTENELQEFSLNATTQDMDTFKLHDRALHVFSEASRVHEFEKACKNGDLHEMGRLLIDSHQSLKQYFECSCDELDRIVNVAKTNCFGSRLTGAGFGGCAIVLCDKKDKERVETTLDILFWTEPSAGIEALELTPNLYEEP